MTTATTTLFRNAFRYANKKGKISVSHSYTDRVDKSVWSSDDRRYVSMVVHGKPGDVYNVASKIQRNLEAVGVNADIRVTGGGLMHYVRATCVLG